MILLHIGVKIFLKNKNGLYLVLKRSSLKYPNIERFWDIPGGRILPGTTLLENLKREVFEETRLQILGEPRLIYAQDIIRLPEKHTVRLTFSSHTDGDPSLGEEHTDYRWVTLDEMRKLEKLDEFTQEVLEKELI